MPVIDGIIEGNSQFNADNKAGIDVSLVKGAFYVVDDLVALEAISENRLSNLIAELYFASSKINMSKDDLSGPFIKIQ